METYEEEDRAEAVGGRQTKETEAKKKGVRKIRFSKKY